MARKPVVQAGALCYLPKGRSPLPSLPSSPFFSWWVEISWFQWQWASERRKAMVGLSQLWYSCFPPGVHFPSFLCEWVATWWVLICLLGTAGKYLAHCEVLPGILFSALPEEPPFEHSGRTCCWDFSSQGSGMKWWVWRQRGVIVMSVKHMDGKSLGLGWPARCSHLQTSSVNNCPDGVNFEQLVFCPLKDTIPHWCTVFEGKEINKTADRQYPEED